MRAVSVELADVFRNFGREYLTKYGASASFQQKEVLRAVTSCRTAELGGHLYRCDACSKEVPLYNSCLNRHCPKCQGAASAKWAAARSADLLNVPYFHTVFTLPHEFHPLVLRNKELLYNILFRAVRRTLLQIGKNNYRAQLGFFLVLHSWGQRLELHPHIHAVIAGGGLALDGCSWKPFKKRYFVSDKILSRVFRGKFIQYLKRARDKLEHSGIDNLDSLIDDACQKSWVVRTKPPFAGPERVVKYLARYTHRVAVTNRRIKRIKNGRVHFSYKDYAKGGVTKITSLSGTQFIQRFMLHLLPKRFMRIRHYGLLAAKNKTRCLPLARMLLSSNCRVPPSQTLLAPQAVLRCPSCRKGNLRVRQLLLPLRSLPFFIATALQPRGSPQRGI